MRFIIMKLFLFALLPFLCTTMNSQNPEPKPASTTTAPSEQEIHQILVDRVDTYKKSVGLVVGTIGPQGSKVYSYGKMAKGSNTVPDGDTVFEIGSATKVFTSLLLADMVQKSEVKLDDPVSRYLPPSVKVPERNGRKITLIDLATHTSGLPRLPSNFHPRDMSNPYADYTVEEMYAFLSSYQLPRDIGSQYEYSNFGVGLLGHALALKAGMSYEKLVQTRILGPLKMTSTAITLTPAIKAHLAQGHSETLQPVANWDFPTLAGAGAMRSTANDMLKFLAANIGLTQTPLAPAMKAMVEVRRPTGVPNLEIALAWHISTKDGEQMIWHNGGTAGYHSFTGFDPKTRSGVVVLSNSGNSIDDIGQHILDSRYPLAKLIASREHHEIAIDPKVLDAYIGHYELAPGVVVEITHKKDGLYEQLTGQDAFPIFPEGETEFFLKVVDAQITFEKSSDGKVTGLTIHQGGRDTPARKTD